MKAGCIHSMQVYMKSNALVRRSSRKQSSYVIEYQKYIEYSVVFRFEAGASTWVR